MGPNPQTPFSLSSMGLLKVTHESGWSRLNRDLYMWIIFPQDHLPSFTENIVQLGVSIPYTNSS